MIPIGRIAFCKPPGTRRMRRHALAMAGIAGASVFQAVSAVSAEPALSSLLRPEADFTSICQLKPATAADSDVGGRIGEAIEPTLRLKEAEKLVSGGGLRDWNKARQLLEPLARGRSAVSADAKIALARLLLNQEAGAVDEPRAVSLLEAAARSGASSALLELARIRERGGIVPKSAEMAAALYRQAFLAGSPTAAFELARLYHQGEIAPPAPDTIKRLVFGGFSLFLDDLARGDCLTFRRLSLVFGDPASPVYDPALSRRWLETAVRTGDTTATLAFASIYDSDGASKADIDRALEVIKGIGGSPKASRIKAKLHLRRGEPNDRVAALEILQEQTGRNDPQALALSASILSGDYGGKPDLERKRKLLQDAAARPAPDAALLAELSDMLRGGAGGPADPSAADDLVARAAKLGDPRSLQRLARSGDKASAAELQRQADAQIAPARRALAELHLCSGTTFGRELARDLLVGAARRGDTESARRLGTDPTLVPDAGGRTALLTQAAEGGNRLAMLDLAVLYRSDRNRPDPALAEQWERRALRPGHGQPAAAARLAALRLDRATTEAERAQRLKELLDLAADGQGDAEAKAGAILLETGDTAAALPLLTRAASFGNADAMFALAASGAATRKMWLERAANAGNPDAILELVTSAPDRASAAPWLVRFQSQAGCDARRLVQLARIYADNAGPMHDEARAAEILARAGSIGAGDPTAEFTLGLAYRDGIAGVPDLTAARHHFQRAHSAGHKAAALELARDLLSGEPPDLAQSVTWFTRAYEAGRHGAPVELIRALIAREALETPAFQEALQLLQRSASDGWPDALRQLALLYERGQGVAADVERSLALLRRSADAGNTAAMRDLAKIYSAGLGVTLSLSESTKWIRRAAESGDVKAMRELASALRVGLGVDADPAAADRWAATADKTSTTHRRSTRP